MSTSLLPLLPSTKPKATPTPSTTTMQNLRLQLRSPDLFYPSLKTPTPILNKNENKKGESSKAKIHRILRTKNIASRDVNKVHTIVSELRELSDEKKLDADQEYVLKLINNEIELLTAYSSSSPRDDCDNSSSLESRVTELNAYMNAILNGRVYAFEIQERFRLKKVDENESSKSEVKRARITSMGLLTGVRPVIIRHPCKIFTVQPNTDADDDDDDDDDEVDSKILKCKYALLPITDQVVSVTEQWFHIPTPTSSPAIIKTKQFKIQPLLSRVNDTSYKLPGLRSPKPASLELNGDTWWGYISESPVVDLVGVYYCVVTTTSEGKEVVFRVDSLRSVVSVVSKSDVATIPILVHLAVALLSIFVFEVLRTYYNHDGYSIRIGEFVVLLLSFVYHSRTTSTGKAKEKEKELDVGINCGCLKSFLPASMMKGFGGMEMVIKMGIGGCYKCD